jgi:GTPase involved in cell partitioning and DNA repair
MYSEIDKKGRFPTYDKLNEEIEKYQLALFKPSTYVLPQYKDQYQGETNVRNFSQENREKFLIGMMKVNFLKRLESSVKSFAITMERTVNKIEDLEARLKRLQEAARRQVRRLASHPVLDGGGRRRGTARSL